MSNVIFVILRVLLCIFWGFICYYAGRDQGIKIGKQDNSEKLSVLSNAFVEANKECAKVYTKTIEDFFDSMSSLAEKQAKPKKVKGEK